MMPRTAHADAAMLARLIDRMRTAERGEEALAQAWEGVDGEVLAATYFLLDPLAQASVLRYVTDTLPRLLPQLRRASEKQPVEYRHRVRGQILWPATQKARHNRDYDPGRFICHQVHRRYDLLENQLVRYMVQAIIDCLKLVPAPIRQGVCYIPDALPIATLPRLGRIQSAIDAQARNVRLRTITLPDRISREHLAAANRARNVGYIETARLYTRYEKICVQGEHAAIQASGWRIIPLPAQPGPTTDPWIDLGAQILVQRQ